MYFTKIFQILFIVGSTFLIFIPPEYLNNSWWCFSSSFSAFEDLRRVSLKSWFVISENRDSSLLPSSRNCFDRENYFHPSGAIQEHSQFVIRSSSIQGYSFTAFSYSSPNLTGASIKYPLISS